MESAKSNLSKGLSATGRNVAASIRYWMEQYTPGEYCRFSIRQKGQPVDVTIRQLPPALSARLMQMSNKREESFRLLMLCTYALLLSKYTGMKKFMLGVRAAGNPVSVVVDPALTFKELLLAVKAQYEQSLVHASFPLEVLLDKLDISVHTFYAGYFDAPAGSITATAQELTPLVCNTAVEGDSVMLSLHTAATPNINPDHFLDHFLHLLTQIVNDPHALHTSYVLPDAAERQILREWGTGAVNDTGNQHILTCWEHQVNNAPMAIAVSGTEGILTYAQLDTNAHRIAAYMHHHFGISAGDIVAVMCERGHWQVSAVMGILKLGATFITIDRTLPHERITYMLQDAAASLLVTDVTGIEGYAGTQWLITGLPAEVPVPGTLPELRRDVQQPVYLIYTSGTTGRPKGTPVSHASFVNMIRDQQSGLQITTTDKILQFASPSFDAAVFEIFLAFLSGACLVQVTTDIIRSPVSFETYINAQGVSFMLLPPVYLSQLNKDRIASVKTICAGGDYPLVADLKALVAKGVHCYNLYGPSETAVIAAAYAVGLHDEAPLPVGRPVSNTFFYVLDEHRQLLPAGIRGELYIGGISVGQGYLSQSALTAEKFIPDSAGNGHLYKTGDWAWWRADGQLVLDGRVDEQVKINGYRIEPMEVQRRLEALPGIKEAAVIIDKEPDGKSVLRAFYTAAGTLVKDQVQALLQQQLPAYMLPASIQQVATIPLTHAGKTDRKILQSLWAADQEALQQEVYVPQHAVALAIQQVWKQVLNKQLGPDQHFFNEGGDSIKAIQACSRLNAMGYQVAVRDIFTYPTINKLAQVVKEYAADPTPVAVEGEMPLSPIQQLFLSQEHPKPAHFNQAVVIRLHTPRSTTQLNEIFTRLVTHHDALRIIFHSNENGYTQKNLPAPLPVKIVVHHLREKENAEKLVQQLAEEVQSTFSLDTAPLLRVDHYQLATHDYLGITVHHLVIDAVSWGIILEDLDFLLQQPDINEALLPGKTTSWKAWCEAMTQRVPMPLEQLPATRLSTGTNAVDSTVGRTAVVSFVLDEVSTRQLNEEVHAAYGTNVQDFLLAALGKTLFGILESDDISLDIETHGRQVLEGMDVSRTVGWFTGIYPFYLSRTSLSDIATLIVHTKDTLRRMQVTAPDYMHAMREPEAQRNSILFNYLGTAAGTGYQHFDWSDITPKTTQDPGTRRNYDWEINAIIAEGKLLVSYTYDKDYFDESLLSSLAAGMKANLLELTQTVASSGQHLLTLADLVDDRLEWNELKLWQETAALEDVYPLTPMQEGMLYHYLVDPSTIFYTTQLGYELSGTLDTTLLAKAYQQLIARHSGLRSNFIQDRKGKAWQLVKRQPIPAFTIEDISSMDPTAAADYIRQVKTTELEKGFDLANDFLMRISIFQLSPGRFYFLWNYHHIIMDGWCMSILVAEWMTLYSQALQGFTATLPPVRPYRDYISWLHKKDYRDAYQYWQQYLDGYEGGIQLPPTGIAADKVDASARLNRELLLDEATTAGIRQLATKFNVTLNVLVQGVWSLILSRYTGSNDVVFGTVVSGRPAELEQVEAMVGLFINTICIRSRLYNHQLFSVLLEQLQEHQLASAAYQSCSLAEVQSRWGGAMALVDHLLLFENFPVAETLVQSLTGEEQLYDFAVTGAEAVDVNNYPFTLVVVPGNQLQIRINFNPQVHPEYVVDHILQYFLTIFKRLESGGDQMVFTLNRYPETLQQLLLAEGRTEGRPVTEAATFVAQFRQTVQSYADRPAVTGSDGILTYLELDAKANRLGNLLLQQYNVQQGAVVAVHLERSVAAIVAICGILKAGAVYVPIDPAWPDARKEYILRDAGVVAIVALFDHFADLMVFGNKVIAIDIQLENEQLPATPPAAVIQPDDLAYIIYTSGSTGQPKGVQIQHRSNVNMALDQVQQFGINANDRILQFAPIFFDASVYEWSIAFYAGAGLFIPDERTIREQERFTAYLSQHSISMATLPPPFFNLLPADTTSWPRVVVQAGSAPDTAKTIAVSRYASCYNAYGPTECAVCATVYLVTETDERMAVLPVGRPLGGNRICLLDDNLEMVPMGAEGEICVSGINVSAGYIGATEQQSAFILHPLISGERLYRTGDMGRMLSGYQLLYTGRKDRQLKVKGCRIEPREVEAALRKLEGVEEAAVGAEKEPTGTQMLVAYVVTNNDTPEKQLKQQLQATLPAYMIPDRIIAMDAIPVTANGKVDFDQLKKRSTAANSTTTHDLPADETEKQLYEIWQSILGPVAFGIHDRFFEAGGNSLSLIRLHARLKELYPGILVADLFNYNTIAEMAAHITAVTNTQQVSVNAGINYVAALSAATGKHTAHRNIDFPATAWNRLRNMFSETITNLEDEDLLLTFFCFVLYEGTGHPDLKIAILDKSFHQLRQLLEVNIDAIDSRESLMKHMVAQRLLRKTAPTAIPLYTARFEKTTGQIVAAFSFGGMQQTTVTDNAGIDLLLKSQVTRSGDIRISLEWQQQTIDEPFAITLLQGITNIVENLINNSHD